MRRPWKRISILGVLALASACVIGADDEPTSEDDAGEVETSETGAPDPGPDGGGRTTSGDDGASTNAHDPDSSGGDPDDDDDDDDDPADDDGDDDDDDTGASTGAAEDTGSAEGTGDTSGTAADVFFAMDVLPIIQSNCGCHRSGSPAAGLDLRDDAAYGTLVDGLSGAGLTLVDPGNPDGSYVLAKLQGTQVAFGGGGNQMPLGGDLFDQDIETIAEWVAQGAEP